METGIWIETDLKKIGSLYKKCRESNETALMSYLVSIAKMLNSLANIENSTMYRYEKKILWRPIKVFSRYFIEQVKEALGVRDAEVKKRIIVDIEDAVTRVVTVYKNLVDNTANADKQVFTSFGFDTSVYELSPKLTAFYSDILESVTKMFDPEGENYAFLLYPNLKHNTEAYHLFRERVGGGRVTIVYIPECKMDLVDIIPIFLLHEAFHVLTDTERNRRLRAGTELKVMTETLSQCLLHEINLDEKKWWNELIIKWFADIPREIKAYEHVAPDDTVFFGKNILESHNDLLRRIVCELDKSIEKDLLEICNRILHNPKDDTFSQFKKIYKNTKETEQVIHENVQYILSGQIIRELLGYYMFVFREVYADIAFLLLTSILPDQYEIAFKESMPFLDEYYTDRERMVRVTIVSNVLSRYGDPEQKQRWEEKYDEEIEEIKTNQLHDEGGYANIMYTKAIEEELILYFDKCSAQLSSTIDSLADLKEFRGTIRRILSTPRDETLYKIYSGIQFSDFK